jgi:hypothetical protein
MSAPTAGPTTDAAMNWPVFCAPSARPAQAGPAISATEVKASPLSATVTRNAGLPACIVFSQRTSITAGSGDAANALSSRLRNTCTSRNRSASIPGSSTLIRS